MAIVQISKIQQRSGNLVDLPQLDEAEFGWASDNKRLFIGKTTPNENIEVLTGYSQISFSQIDGSVGNLNINPVTVADGQVLTYDGTNWVNRGAGAGGNINLGDVSNVHISGGAIGYVLETDGLGNLSWTPKSTIIAFIENVTKANPAVVTTTQDNFLTEGALLTVTDAVGMTQLNGNSYYANILTANTFSLYSDPGLTVPVDSTGYGTYAYTTATATTVAVNTITVGDSALFSLNQAIQFVGNMSTSGINNDDIYYVKTIPGGGVTITISNELLANGSAGNTLSLQTTTGLTAHVYAIGGRVVSSVGAGGGGNGAQGSNTSVQYNNNNLLDGDADFTWNFGAATKLLTVNGNANVGNINSSGIGTATRYISNIATGTAPLTVTSTTRVANLNVAYSNVTDFTNITTSTTGSYYLVMANALTGNVPQFANNALQFNALTGNLSTTLLNVTSNANIGNLGVSTAIISVGNITTINSGLMQNGNSNITITANGNIGHYVTGNATSQLTVTATGANIPGTANVVGNANVGNLGTGGLIVATGNITGGNLVTSGTLSVTGNANLGNIGTAGLIIATGNITGGNLTTAGVVTATGNVSGGNLTTAGVVTATGNVSGGNLTTGGALSVTGNANVGNLGATNGVFTSNVTAGNLYANSGTLGVSTANITTLNVTGRSNLNVVGNVYISGGSANQILKTDGSGNLSWTDPTGGYYLHTQTSANTTWTVVHNLNRQYVTVEPIDSNGNSYVGRYDYPTINYTNANALTMTFTSAVSGWAAVVGGGLNLGNISGNYSPAGVNTQVQFNDAGNMAGSSGLVYDKTTGTLTATYLSGNGSNIASIAGANVTGQVTYAATANAVAGANVSGAVAYATTANSVAGANVSGAVAYATTANSVAGANVTGTVSQATTVMGATQNNITTLGALTTLSTGANTTAGTITGNWTLSTGSKMQATYADLAEYYEADKSYEPGTVLEFGGEKEVTIASDGTQRVAGVVSTNPAYVMNSQCPGHAVAIALQGRVPTKVRGTVHKGDMMVSAGNGFARTWNNPAMGTVIGKALENFDGIEGVIEIAVGRL